MESKFGGKALQRFQALGRHFFKSPFQKKPMKVVVTGASGQIGYILCFMIAQGRMLGPYQPVILQLLDLPMMEKALQGLRMQLTDGSFPLLTSLIVTSSPQVAFKDADVAVMVGAKPRGPGMERKDLLSANGKIFKAQGAVLDKVAKKTVKVLVVGNPANTNAMIMMRNAPSIPPQNFTALTRLDLNRANGQVAEFLGVENHMIKNLIVWGNHSSTQVPDISHGYIENQYENDIHENVRTAICNDEYIFKSFVETVRKRGAAIIKARKLSSAASAANAACDHIHDWFIGTKKGQWTSMSVLSNGQYGIPKGIIYSFPCICKDFKWKIIEGLKISQWSRTEMDKSAKELLDEQKAALGA